MARINNSWQLLELTFSKSQTAQKKQLHTEYFSLPRNKTSLFLTYSTFIFKYFNCWLHFMMTSSYRASALMEKLEYGMWNFSRRRQTIFWRITFWNKQTKKKGHTVSFLTQQLDFNLIFYSDNSVVLPLRQNLKFGALKEPRFSLFFFFKAWISSNFRSSRRWLFAFSLALLSCSCGSLWLSFNIKSTCVLPTLQQNEKRLTSTSLTFTPSAQAYWATKCSTALSLSAVSLYLCGSTKCSPLAPVLLDAGWEVSDFHRWRFEQGLSSRLRARSRSSEMTMKWVTALQAALCVWERVMLSEKQSDHIALLCPSLQNECSSIYCELKK